MGRGRIGGRRRGTPRHDPDWLRGHGAEATGEIGDHDPVQSARDALLKHEADEIILSTLPVGISRWIGQDVPSRLRGAVALPVTVVTAAPAPSEAADPGLIRARSTGARSAESAVLHSATHRADP